MNKVRHIETKLKKLVVDVIEERKKGFFTTLFKGALYLLSQVFKFVVSIKRLLYKVKILKQKNPPLPVVCIGNIVAGGTGKTPMVIHLTDLLSKKFKVAVVSKGYLGTRVSKHFVKRASKHLSAKYFGDEPIMIKNKLPDAEVLISKDRMLSCKKALSLGCDISVMDDGFQDLSIKKHLNVVMVNVQDPFGKNYFLPRGFLRQSPKGLKRADYIGVTGDLDAQAFEKIEKKLGRISRAKVFGMAYEPLKIQGEQSLELDQLKNLKIGVFSAIGNPQLFEKMLGSLGAEIVSSQKLVDHSNLSSQELEDFINTCKRKNAKLIVCTEKDYVKIDKRSKSRFPIAYLNAEFKVCYNAKHFAALEKQILNLVKR